MFENIICSGHIKIIIIIQFYTTAVIAKDLC